MSHDTTDACEGVICKYSISLIVTLHYKNQNNSCHGSARMILNVVVGISSNSVHYFNSGCYGSGDNGDSSNRHNRQCCGRQ